MVDSKINLTYDSLFEIVLREKNHEELQKLPSDFVRDLVGYLSDKKGLVEAKRLNGSTDDIVFKQFSNAKLLIRDLYECRKRKIVRMALVSSFGTNKQNIDVNKDFFVDVSVFLSEERVFFDSCIKVFDRFRSDFFDHVVDGKAPVVSVPKKSIENNYSSEDKSVESSVNVNNKSNLKSVRFLDDTEVVVDSELRPYGPFKREDVAQVPLDLAEVLVSNGKVEIV